MKTISVSIDDETYRKAHAKAAANDISLSLMVRNFLVDVTSDETEFEAAKREEARLRARVDAFRASDRLRRDDLHDRSA